ncbi:MAG: FAD:protein FMN transferase [Oscillospiraceae bacterium]
MKNSGKKIFTSMTFLLAICLCLSFTTFYGCHRNVVPHKTTGFAMGTVISQALYDDDAEVMSKKISSEIKKMEESYLSWRIEGSDVYRINNNADQFVAVNDLTYNWIKTSLDVSKNCNGIFDITIGNLTSLWNIGTEHPRVPSQDEINNALKTIDYQRVELSDKKVKCATNQQLDLGGIGKGAACDRIEQILDKAKYGGAVISVGGSILLHGQNPNADKWSVGIRNPRSEAASDYVAILKVDNGCVSTSGDYERVFKKDGVSYHHILDTRTGYPSDSGFISVTIVCDSGVLSDILSTACFILGYEDSLKLLDKYDAEAVFIDKDLNVYATSGIKDSLKITNDSYKLVKG